MLCEALLRQVALGDARVRADTWGYAWGRRHGYARLRTAMLGDAPLGQVTLRDARVRSDTCQDAWRRVATRGYERVRAGLRGTRRTRAYVAPALFFSVVAGQK